jgi:hypothetical protein
MKTCLKYLMTMVLVAFCAFYSAADEHKDTVYIYNSWAQIYYMEPSAILYDAQVLAYSPFSVNILTSDEAVLKQVSEEGHIVISIGEEVWLANADYIKQEFKGDVKYFDGYVPIFFTEKAAFLTYPDGPSVKEILFGEEDYDELSRVVYFHIDFEKKRVKKVTPKYLSELLEDYHDLQMRYEGMKDYKKNDIIEYFYLQYIDRVNQDDFKPYIVDLEASEIQ